MCINVSAEHITNQYKLVFSFRKLTIHCRRVILQSKCCFQWTEDFGFLCFYQLSPNGSAFFERVVLHLTMEPKLFWGPIFIFLFLTTIAWRYNSWNSRVKKHYCSPPEHFKKFFFLTFEKITHSIFGIL